MKMDRVTANCSSARHCGWIPVLPLSLELWGKFEAWKRAIHMTGEHFTRETRSCQTSRRRPTHPARPWRRGRPPPSSSRWLWSWTSSASSSSSSGSSHRWASGTSSCCPGLCWSSSASSSGYSGTWGTSGCLTRSSTSPNATSCDFKRSRTELRSAVWWRCGGETGRSDRSFSKNHEFCVRPVALWTPLRFLPLWRKCDKSKSRHDQEHIWLIPGDKKKKRFHPLTPGKTTRHVVYRQHWLLDFVEVENVFSQHFYTLTPSELISLIINTYAHCELIFIILCLCTCHVRRKGFESSH